jgi:adenylate kinase
MRLILLGLPGAGKGTQAKVLAERHGLLHISTGDMFRQAAAEGTDLGRRAQEFMSRGELVPDAVTIGMLLERIAKPDANVGFMLDGFPRTIPQAEALDRALADSGGGIDAVLYIQVPEDLLMARLTGRWSCPQCGAIYHELTNPPKQRGVCDQCGSTLSQRQDDRPDRGAGALLRRAGEAARGGRHRGAVRGDRPAGARPRWCGQRYEGRSIECRSSSNLRLSSR